MNVGMIYTSAQKLSKKIEKSLKKIPPEYDKYRDACRVSLLYAVTVQAHLLTEEELIAVLVSLETDIKRVVKNYRAAVRRYK